MGSGLRTWVGISELEVEGFRVENLGGGFRTGGLGVQGFAFRVSGYIDRF